jgi:predicted transcriptional regulator
MSLAEVLRAKSSEYELLAEWHGERAPLDEEHLVACQALLAVGIVLREVAQALDVEWGEEADAY